MKALTLWQPWATLIAIGAKKIETLGWPTWHRGPLAIHAGKKMDEEIAFFARQEPIRRVLVDAGIRKIGDMPFGAVVCVVDLVDCYQIRPDNVPGEPERSFGNYKPGRWAWVLDNVRPLDKPVPARGSQMLWEWDAAEQAALGAPGGGERA